MLGTLLGSNDKKAKKETAQDQSIKEARDLFLIGRFPVVTTQVIENRPIAKVLGLVCCRGFDSEEAFFGMAAMAVKKGAQGIIGYSENIAFHPDGSKYFSCFGTAVMFQREGRSDLLSDQRTIKNTLSDIPNAHIPSAPDSLGYLYEGEKLSLNPNAKMPTQDTADFSDPSAKSSIVQLAAQMASEEANGVPVDGANALGMHNSDLKVDSLAQKKLQPSEEEDPVLQRLLASQKRQASSAWQQ